MPNFFQQGITNNVKLHLVLVTPHGQITISIEQDKIEWMTLSKILVQYLHSTLFCLQLSTSLPKFVTLINHVNFSHHKYVICDYDENSNQYFWILTLDQFGYIYTLLWKDHKL